MNKKAARELLLEAIRFGAAEVPEAVVIFNQAGLMLFKCVFRKNGTVISLTDGQQFH